MAQSEDQTMKISVSDRIHLSEILPTDQAACVQHLKEKAIYDRTLRIPYPYTEADFQAFLQIVEKATMEQGRPVHWAIRTEDNELVGATGFNSLQIGKSHQAEIGYWLAKPYWGRGIMTAVARTACALAFAEFGLVKIMAQVHAGNAASAKVLEKCGFRQEGYLRKHVLKDGNYLDVKLFGLLKE
jgi:[ribosomal protein S5]-alanine N-acetyltransferase